MTAASAARRLPSWIESFLELTDHTVAPRIYRKWAAVATISGALERKVWTKALQRVQYPNTFILLVGGPGVGKTDALRNVRGFWEHLPDLRIAPSSVSRASLTDSLNDARRSIVRPTENLVDNFNSLQVCAEELGTFLTAYEGEFMSNLNHLWDSVKFSESKRSMKDPIMIEKPSLSIVAATTPSWLGTSLPDQAWAEGFCSRLLMVYSGEKIKVDPFIVRDSDAALEANLVSDLMDIHAMYGQMKFTEEFVSLFRQWYLADCPPQPDHPRLEHYATRRAYHFLKLCIICSAGRASDYVIRAEDFQYAMDLLIEVEVYMPDVFRALRSGDVNVLDECYAFVWQVFAKENRGVAEHRIVHFLAQRTPSHNVARVLEVMVQSHMLIIDSVGEKGRNTYKPTPKTSF